MRSPTARFEIVRRLITAFAYSVALLSCGRDPVSPTADSMRVAHSLALSPVFPPAYQQVPDAFAAAPFTSVRAVFLEQSGVIAFDTLVAFPASADSLSLSFAIPLSADAPVSGEPLTALLYCLNAQGDTVFKGGPVNVIAVPSTDGAAHVTPVSIPLAYTGPGANAASVRITPKSLTVTSGDQFTFAASAVDQNGQPIAGAPVMFRAVDATLASLASAATGSGQAIGAHGSTFVIAQLITGQADTAILTVQPKASALQLVSGGGQSGVAGMALAQSVVVRAVSNDGTVVPGVPISFVASGNGSPTPATTVTSATGLAQTIWKLGSAGGAQTLTITSSAIASAQAIATATATVAGPGVATKLAFNTQPANTIAASSIGPSIAVSAEDALGNVVSSFTGAVTLALAGPAATTLTGTTTVNAVAGVATFTSASLTKAATGYRLVATASGLTPDSSAAFAVGAAGAAKITASSGDKQTGTPAAALGASLAVLVTDVFGNPVSGFAVTWTVPTGSGSIASSTSITNASGIATDAWTLGTALGAQTAVASASGLTGSPVTFSATSAAGVATKLVISAQPTNAVAGAVLAPAIVVQAKDGLNDLQTSFTGNVAISFGTNPGTGSLGGTLTVAAVAGVATFSDLSIKKAAAGYTFAVSSGTLTPDTSAAFTVGAAPAANLAISAGGGQSGAVSSALGSPLGVTVTDAFGNPVSLVNVIFAVTSGGGTLSSTTVPTNAAGMATAVWTLGSATGAQSVTASAAGLTGSPATFTATALAGGATHLSITSEPASVVAGAAIAPAIVVQARDASGNPAASFAGTVSLSFATNPGGATLSGGVSVSAIGGVATFSGVSLNKAAAGYRLVASAAGVSGDTSSAFAVSNAAASAISSAGGASQTALVASALPSPLSVVVNDAFGNPVPGATITWAVTAGGGAVSPASSATNALGIATTAWTLGGVAGTGTVTASAAGLTGSPVSFASTAIASAATKLAIVSQPSNVLAGVAIAPPIVVQARDASNNLVSAFNGSVALSLGTNPGGATLGGTTTVSASGGVATFSSVTLNKSGSGITVVASAGGLASDNSTAFSVTNAAAATLAITSGNNQSSAASVALASPLSVTVDDALGNPVSGVTVAWAISTGGGSLGAASSVTNASGVATNTWTLGALAGLQAVTASAASLTGSPATFVATATAGAATKLVITSQPTSATAGVNLAPSLVVTAEDAAGNVATTFGGSVALSLATNPGGGSLGGTIVVNAVAGIATFSSVSLSKAATGYRIGASSGSLTQDTSAPFSITAAAAASLALSSGGGQSGLISLALGSPLTVTVTDAFANPVSGVSVNWSVAAGGGTLSAATTATNASGIATNSWTLGSALGAQSVTASANGLAGSPATFSATGLAGAATKLVISTLTGGGVAGAAIGLVATAEDASGNVATSFAGPVTLAFAANPGSGTLTGTTTVNAVAGVATFAGLSIVKAAAGYSLIASASGLSPATSNIFDIDAAGVAAVAVTGGNNQSGAVALALLTPLAVTVVDAYANPVPNATVNWAVSTGGGVLATSTVQTNATGVATNTWTLGAMLGAQTVTATAAGLASSPVTFSATGLVGAATSLVISAIPSTTIAGAILGPSIAVTAKDALGNTATTFTGAVSLAFGANPSGATLGGTVSVNAVAGVATFTSLSVIKAAAGYSLVASASGLTSATSGTFGISAAAAAAVSVTSGNNQSGVVALLLGSPLTVTVLDMYANPVPGVNVAWSIAAGGGSLGGATTQTSASGVATNTWILGALLGAQSVTASVSGVLSSATFTATGLVGAAASLVMSAIPASTLAGALLGPSIAVTAKDSQGNTVTSFTGAVSVAFGANPGGASLSGTTTVNAVAGIATFSNLAVTTAASGYTIVASAAGLSPATSSPLSIVAAAASKLVLTSQPGSAIAGVNLAPSLVATAQDAYGNLATTFTGAVSVGFGMNPGSGTLAGTTSVNAVAGVATFASVSIAKAATGYSLVASAAGLSSATTNTFSIGAAAAAAITIAGGNMQSGLLGALLGTPLSVLVTDAFGNPVSGHTVTWAVTLGGASLGLASSTTNASGIATNTVTLPLLATLCNISASIAEVATPVVFTVTSIL
jgi:Bacterial Ig-like domain (group 1)